MGCCNSTANVPTSPTSPPTTQVAGSEGPQHEAIRSASQVPAESPSKPKTAARAPPLSSVGNGGSAYEMSVLSSSQAPPPFAADASAPPHKGDAVPVPKPPQRAVLAPSFPRNEGMPVSPLSRRVAESAHRSVPIDRSISAQPPTQSGLPPRAVLASSPPHDDGIPMSLPSQRGGGTRAPSSFRAAPVNRSISAQPLSPSGLAVPSSLSMARTMSASESPPNTKSNDMPRKQPRSTPGTNKVHVAEDNGHQRFPSTVRTVLSDNFRFRILVIGKRSSGKSSLINSAFKVDMSTALGDMARTLKTSDINTGFESGAVQNMSTVRKFIIDRTHANCSTSERLHAIWICVPTSDVVDGNLGDGVDEILGLNGVVPVVVVATKFDLFVSQNLIDVAGGDTRFYDQARTTALERYERSCRSLFPRNTRDLPVETVSTKTKFGDLIPKLITTTHKLITDPRNALSVTRVANSQVAPVPLVWSIAQRVSHDLIIQASIEVGRGEYWRTLGSSPDFTDQIFEDCVDVIHTDIVGVWSLRDEDGYLLGRKFKARMYDLVKDLTESHIGSQPLSSKPSGMLEHHASTSGTGWTSTSYQNSVEDVRCMMGYIVDLTVILYGFFVSDRDVSASKVREAMDYHVKSGLRRHIHQDISRFVTKEVLSPYRGNDLCVEKIIDLMRQSCAPRQNT